MEKTTITVEVSESFLLDQGKFRMEGIMNKLREAGIPARLADVTRGLFVTDGILTHNYNVAEGVLTIRWTGAVSAIVEDTPKPRNTGELMNAWRQERYELGQLLRKVKPHLVAAVKTHELAMYLVCANAATEGQLAELEEIIAQVEIKITSLPKEKP